ncbi:helix-turn-helix transcriptional regulator [Proteiniphilum sp.]|uniref:helix-turn-helix domain-containing protein n=1 Tax=Proteiniphilum sp. TaxID=1926877 RepID=UPI00331A0493
MKSQYLPYLPPNVNAFGTTSINTFRAEYKVDTTLGTLTIDFELVYKFDAGSILQHYKGIFTNSALERMTGINQRQLQRYASGETKPRVEQAKKISEAFNKLGKELQVVKL